MANVGEQGLMSEILIRNVSQDEAATVTQMIRLMMTDMANYGSYAPATDDTANPYDKSAPYWGY